MQTENDTPKPEDSPEQATGEGCSGATCSASLFPVAYRIEQQQAPHTYWIQRMTLGSEGPLWFILLRLGDPSSYLRSLKSGYATPESALQAWQEYADLNWPNAKDQP